MTGTYAAARHMLVWGPGTGQSLSPALVGPTGSGKTMMAASLARDLGLERHTLLLGTMLPEDVLGLPHIVGDTTTYTLPEWAREAIDHPVLIHLDELDKARPEVLSTVLTLVSDRRVHDVPLHPHTRILMSGQPVEEYWLSDQAAQAISARVAWLPVAYDWEAIAALGGLDLGWVPQAEIHPVPVLACPSARQVLYLSLLRPSCPREVAEVIARGVLPAALVPEYLSAPEHTPVVTSAYARMAIDEAQAYLDSISPGHAAALLGETMDAQHMAALIGHLRLCGDADLREQVAPRILTLLRDDAIAGWCVGSAQPQRASVGLAGAIVGRTVVW